MTIDNWLMIVQTIVILIAPILAGLVLSRINQPKETPVVSQPPSRIQRIGGWFRRVGTSPRLYILFIMLIVWNLLDLASEIRSTGPLDRRGVFSIVLPIASIVVNLGILAYLTLLKLWANFLPSYTRFMNSFTDFATSITKNVTGQSAFENEVVDALKKLSDAIQPKPKVEPPKRPPIKRAPS